MNEVLRNRMLFEEAFKGLIDENIFVDVPMFGLSMFPFILPNDQTRVIKAKGHDLNIGDVIVFSNNGRLIAHRLLKIDLLKKVVISKGDGLIKKDIPMHINDVQAVVVGHYRKGSEIKWINKPSVKIMIARLSPFVGILNFCMGRFWNKFFN